MSKKRGHKKNVDLEEDVEEKKVQNISHDITSKSKGKGKKKGKGNIDDHSDSDDGVPNKTQLSEGEDNHKPAQKKSQKKGSSLMFMIHY